MLKTHAFVHFHQFPPKLLFICYLSFLSLLSKIVCFFLKNVLPGVMYLTELLNWLFVVIYHNVLRPMYIIVVIIYSNLFLFYFRFNVLSKPFVHWNSYYSFTLDLLSHCISSYHRFWPLSVHICVQFPLVSVMSRLLFRLLTRPIQINYLQIWIFWLPHFTVL